MSAVVRKRLDGPCRRLLRSVPGALAVAVLFAFLAQLQEPPTFAAQSKEACRKCCEGKGYDEYFLEQCKLQCFRDPDHCVGGKAEARPSREPERHEAAQPRPRASFKWPHPLNLVSGREWEAAAQILSMNGISPNDPNAAKALAAVESILKRFVQSHPSGGRLPTAQIERVIRKYR